jgi:hypothetical protein
MQTEYQISSNWRQRPEALSVCIATPAYEGSCRTGYVESLMHLVLALASRGIETSYVTTSKSALVAVARNACVRYFLEGNASHLLFIDADMRFRADDVIRMLEHGDRDVVGALYPGKEYDWERITRIARQYPELTPSQICQMGATYVSATALHGDRFNLDDTDEQGLIEVSALGTGLMLIRRDVFTRLEVAHPEWRVTNGGALDGGMTFFEGGRIAGGFQGEDVAFCHAARAIGCQVFTCPWFRISHIGHHEFVGDPSISHF